jgi:GAF domain-containing protein
MTDNPSYAELESQFHALFGEYQRLKAAEEVFYRQSAYLKTLHETSLELIDKLDKEKLLENILERAVLLSGTSHGYIYFLEPGEAQLQMQVGMGFFKSQIGRRVAIGQGLGGRVWEIAAPVVVEDYQCWPGRIPDKVLDSIHSVVGIPLK